MPRFKQILNVPSYSKYNTTMVVKQIALDLGVVIDVSNYEITGEKKVRGGILHKIRFNGKAKIVLPVKKVSVLEVHRSKDGSYAILLHPQSQLVCFILELEKQCAMQLSDNNLIRDGLCASVKFHPGFGKVVCIRASKSSVDVCEGRMVDLHLRLEGVVVAKNSDRFNLTWTVIGAEPVEEFVWEPIEYVDEQGDDDDVATPDATDINDMIQELMEKITTSLDACVRIKDDTCLQIDALKCLQNKLKSCGVDDLSEVESIRAELDAIPVSMV